MSQQPAIASDPPADVAPTQPTSPDVFPTRATAPFTGSPEDAQVLAGLRARRDLLSEQLERVGERRRELAQEISQGGPARRGLEQRLQVLDDQVVQLERDIVTTDRQLAAAPPQLLAQTEQPEPHVVHTGPSDEDVAAIGFSGFGLGILLMLVAGRIRRWRRRGERAAARDAAGPDPRIDRLAHAVDAIAVEVERIGEGQRFVTQLLAESRAGAQQAGYPPAGEPRYVEAGVTADALPAPGRPR